jgi:UDP-2,3-diacylglucosamine hydrolase
MSNQRRVLFVADLHLCQERPALTAAFLRFAGGEARAAGALYILGDLFEVWVGDDQLDHDPLARQVAAALAALADGGTAVSFMHGNRDFLIGARFAREARLDLLGETEIVELAGRRTLLLHGDTLCTGDIAYQQFRATVRNPDWQRDFLAKPYAERATIARSIRSKSDVEKSMKAEAIMDVDDIAVRDAFRNSACSRMIHGHTHRPARHVLAGNGGISLLREVLPDWREGACGLAVSGESVERFG